jgi:beta-phosphoglucomutase
MVVAVRELLTAPAAVIFDFNGTLSADEPLLARLFVQIFGEVGIDVSETEYWDEYAGLSDPEIVRRVLARCNRSDPDLARQLLDRRAALYLKLAESESPITPAAADLARRVAGRVPVAIASGAARVEIQGALRSAGLEELFPVIVASEDTTRGKPDPDGYLLALRLLNEENGGRLQAADVLVFEDTGVGLAAARAAGMRCVVVEGTADASVLAEADAVVSALDWSIPLVEGWK